MPEADIPLDRVLFVAFDTETTGTGAGARLLEIAGVRFRGDEVLDTFSELVDPEQPIPPETTAIHHITDDMVRGRERAATVLPRFLEFAGDAVWIAHNAPFDAQILGLEFLRCRLPAPSAPILDTLRAARRLFPSGSHSLDTLADLLGLPLPEARHRALDDAHLLRGLVAKIVDAIGGKTAPYREFEQHAGPALLLSDHVPEPPALPEPLSYLAEACRERRKVRLTIESGGARPQQRVVVPIAWYQWNGIGLLEAKVPEEGRVELFRLDRCLGAEPGASSGVLF